MTNYPELRNALEAFREVFRRKLLLPNAVSMSQEYLQKTVNLQTWTPNDAFRIYQIIKPHSHLLKKVGFDFTKVPQVTSGANVTVTKQTISQDRVVGYDGTNFLVFFSYRPNLVEGVKKIPGAKFNPGKKCWNVPISSNDVLKQFVMGNGFQIGEMAFAIMNNVEENYENSYRSEYIELNLPVKKRFYDFQTGGIDYVRKNKRVIIGDQMGLGKTIQGIGGLLINDAFPAIVICPKGLRLNWQDEIHDWTDKKAMVLSHKNINQLPFMLQSGMVDVVITNFHGIQTFFVEEIKKVLITTGENAGTEYDRVYMNGLEALFKGVILDEAHYCRNKKTLLFKTIRRVFEDKETRICLTGTPVVKGAEDMGALLEMIGMIERFGGYHKFVKQYRKMNKDFVNGRKEKQPSNKSVDLELQNLNIKLRSICFIRREKYQVLKDMPEKFRKRIRVELENQDEYDHALLSLQDYLVSNNVDPEKIESAMRAEILVRINLLKKISARGKLPAFNEFVKDILDSGEKIVVFCWFNETAQTIKDHFRKYNPVTICGRIDGREMKDEEVNANKKAFQTDPKVRMIILTFGKGREGHTLTAASKWACIEPGWTYADHAQAEDRIHRISQENNCECYYFLGAGTVDEDIDKIIEQRRVIEKLATGGTEEIPTETATFSTLSKKLIASVQRR